MSKVTCVNTVVSLMPDRVQIVITRGTRERVVYDAFRDSTPNLVKAQEIRGKWLERMIRRR